MPPRPSRRPTTDWRCTSVLDAKQGDPDGSAACEECGRAIRWVHVLEHDAFDRPIEAGCCCAARLCNGYDAAAAERAVKGRAGRLARFVDATKWKRSRRNPDNYYRLVKTAKYGEVTVTVFVKDEGYRVYLAGRNGDRWCDEASCTTREGAKRRAFELVEILSGYPVTQVTQRLG